MGKKMPVDVLLPKTKANSATLSVDKEVKPALVEPKMKADNIAKLH